MSYTWKRLSLVFAIFAVVGLLGYLCFQAWRLPRDNFPLVGKSVGIRQGGERIFP